MLGLRLAPLDGNDEIAPSKHPRCPEGVEAVIYCLHNDGVNWIRHGLAVAENDFNGVLVQSARAIKYEISFNGITIQVHVHSQVIQTVLKCKVIVFYIGMSKLSLS